MKAKLSNDTHSEKRKIWFAYESEEKEVESWVKAIIKARHIITSQSPPKL